MLLPYRNEPRVPKQRQIGEAISAAAYGLYSITAVSVAGWVAA